MSICVDGAHSIVEVLARHARERPDAVAYRFLDHGEDETAVRTFAAIDERARQVAGWLTRHGLTGQAVLLLLHDNLNFVEAFLGCLYAGVVPVAATIPRPKRPTEHLSAIARDACVAAIVSERVHAAHLQPTLADAVPGARWLCWDTVDERATLRSERVPSHEVAFLQYTSGSTGAPKGVVVTHASLLANELAIQDAMQLSDDTVFVGWLPLFHDMGLVGNLLQPLFLGVSCVLMPPVAFLQKPLRWLRAISKYRGTVSGAPNFAYDLCVDKIATAACAELDLRSWKIAFNGSEPIRASSLQRFSDAFAPYGFTGSSFFPCYGMAESTLLISGGPPASLPRIVSVDPVELRDGGIRVVDDTAGARPLVGCGQPARGTVIRIVDPDTSKPVAPGRIGEVWVSGASVAAGYFRNSDATRTTFRARLEQAANGPSATPRHWLRTGDLGFLASDGELFITGRIKETIIVRGRNHYPQDIEATAERASPLLARGRGAAFAVDEVAGTVGLVYELSRAAWRRPVSSELIADLTQAVAAAHGLTLVNVALVRPNSVPRTSSGKVRRTTCKALWAAGELDLATLRVALQRNHDGAADGK